MSTILHIYAFLCAYSKSETSKNLPLTLMFAIDWQQDRILFFHLKAGWEACEACEGCVYIRPWPLLHADTHHADLGQTTTRPPCSFELSVLPVCPGPAACLLPVSQALPPPPPSKPNTALTDLASRPGTFICPSRRVTKETRTTITRYDRRNGAKPVGEMLRIRNVGLGSLIWKWSSSSVEIVCLTCWLSRQGPKLHFQPNCAPNIEANYVCCARIYWTVMMKITIEAINRYQPNIDYKTITRKSESSVH